MRRIQPLFLYLSFAQVRMLWADFTAKGARNLIFF